MASLIVEWARATRRESALGRAELARLSGASARASHQLAEHCRVWEKEVARAETNRRKLPEWPAWGQPDPELIRTLVPLD